MRANRRTGNVTCTQNRVRTRTLVVDRAIFVAIVGAGRVFGPDGPTGGLENRSIDSLSEPGHMVSAPLDSRLSVPGYAAVDFLAMRYNIVLRVSCSFPSQRSEPSRSPEGILHFFVLLVREFRVISFLLRMYLWVIGEVFWCLDFFHLSTSGIGSRLVKRSTGCECDKISIYEKKAIDQPLRGLRRRVTRDFYGLVEACFSPQPAAGVHVCMGDGDVGGLFLSGALFCGRVDNGDNAPALRYLAIGNNIKRKTAPGWNAV